MPPFIVSIAASLAGNLLIFVGLAFVNGVLLPSMLSSLYGATGTTTRNLMITLACALPANAVFAWCYREAGPTMAGMAQMSTLAIVIIGNVALLGHAIPARAWPAALALLAAAAWFGWEAGNG